MQTHGGAAAEKAIYARERHFRRDLRADWSRNGNFTDTYDNLTPYVVEVGWDASINGSLPTTQNAEARELVVVLAGELENGMSLVEVFSEFNTNSPLYNVKKPGVEIYWDILVPHDSGVATYRQFIGQIRSVVPDRVDNTVTITALDRVEKMRKPVHLPRWAISEEWDQQGDSAAQLVNTQGLIDMCIRQCDVSPTPYSVPTTKEITGTETPYFGGMHVWINGTGSTLPVVGWKDRLENDSYHSTESTGIEMYEHAGAVHPSSPDPGIVPLNIRAKGTNDPSTIGSWAIEPDLVADGQGIYVGYTLITKGGVVPSSSGAVVSLVTRSRKGIYIEQGSGQVNIVAIVNGQVINSGPVTIPTGQPYVRINAVIDFSTADNVRFNLRAGSNGGVWTSYTPYDTAYEYNPENGRFQITDKFPLQDIYYFSRYVLNPSATHSSVNKPAKYVAVLDPGLHRLSFMPDRKGTDAWDIVTEAANAEFGNVFWDENGVFRFWNYNRLMQKREQAVKTLTIDDITSLSMDTTYDNVRNIVSLETQRNRGVEGRIFKADGVMQFYVPGSTVKEFVIPGENIIACRADKITRTSPTSGSSYPGYTDNQTFSYCVQWRTPGGVWQEEDSFTSGLDISARLNADGDLVIRVWNGYDRGARLAANNGQPTLNVRGTRIEDYGTVVTTLKDSVSADLYGDRNLPLQGELYQYRIPLSNIRDGVLPNAAKPVPVTDQITVQGDPRIQLGDCVDIRDASGFGEVFRAQIVGINRSFDNNTGLTDTYNIEVFNAPPFSWNGLVANFASWDAVAAGFVNWNAVPNYVPPV